MTRARGHAVGTAAKGDIVVGNGSNTAASLGVGTDGYILTAASTAATGVQWAAAPVTLTGSQTLTNKTLTAPVITYSINAQTANYTAVASDAAAIVTMSTSAANTFYIPTNASVPFAIGSQITVIQAASGQTTITASSTGTTTIASVGATSTAPKLRVQNSSATIVKTGTDTWYVMGDIA